jgi:hypothetical protein
MPLQPALASSLVQILQASPNAVHAFSASLVSRRLFFFSFSFFFTASSTSMRRMEIIHPQVLFRDYARITYRGRIS